MFSVKPRCLLCKPVFDLQIVEDIIKYYYLNATVRCFFKAPASYSKIPMSIVIFTTTKFFSSSLMWAPFGFFSSIPQISKDS